MKCLWKPQLSEEWRVIVYYPVFEKTREHMTHPCRQTGLDNQFIVGETWELFK
jgi:hypothetical protein